MKDLRPFIGAKDYDVSQRFYTELGFSVDHDDGDLSLLSYDNVSFYLQHYYQREWCDNTMIHLTVNSAAAWYKRAAQVIEEGGYQLARVSAPKQQSYGALVTHLWDPSGVLWHLAERTSNPQPSLVAQ